METTFVRAMVRKQWKRVNKVTIFIGWSLLVSMVALWLIYTSPFSEGGVGWHNRGENAVMVGGRESPDVTMRGKRKTNPH
jgi:hypothetical protein